MAKKKMAAKCCVEAKFTEGDKVRHAANAWGAFPTGCGTVESVTPWNSGDGYSYQVRCKVTGEVLPVNFKESELECDGDE